MIDILSLFIVIYSWILDLVPLFSSYWIFFLAPEARAIITFRSPSEYFKWLLMPFGLKSATISFRKLMNTLSGALLGKDVFAYLNDIICSKDADSNFASLEAVPDKFQTGDLKLKQSKCGILKEKVSFLGHVVDSSGIKTLYHKIEVINNSPKPRSGENIRSFLRLCGYYLPFIWKFSKIASQLNQLMQRGVSFPWDAQQQNSYHVFKTVLTNAPVLQYPNYA